MPAAETAFDRAALLARYSTVRKATGDRCRSLSPEDCLLQSMPEASPVKWHLAHTTWFFETFILATTPEYEPFDPSFNYLFNSYYEAVGPRHPRPQRGLISRPTLDEVWRYRAAIDDRVVALLRNATDERLADLIPVMTLGFNHEEQHQELILTDVLHALSVNPMQPAYSLRPPHAAAAPAQARWVEFASGIRWIGHEGKGFAFDNESPRHRVWVEAFRISNRLATNVEFLAFIEDGGYARPELWLSDGWAAKNAHQWKAPLYWEEIDDSWHRFTLSGVVPAESEEPVCHVSFYEADAFARWAGARLPTEAEWETAVVEQYEFGDQELLAQANDSVWQWTASPYVAYPGYKPAAGALGEYNAKFMCNQMVLRGGSFATPTGHTRPTYRNFFAPETRWQFAGIRLASDR
jgi:ergothioneine biosynthesis protein EgtB